MKISDTFRKGFPSSMSYLESAAPVKSQAAASGLKTSRLTFCEAAMMIVGSTIGSGVLGLAYASRRAGWPVLVIWLAVAALISAVSMLYVAEASLRTRLPLQLSGLAEKYIGKAGSWLLFFAVGATSFCSLIAYTNGCGKILSDLLGISFEAGSLLFILPAGGFITLGCLLALINHIQARAAVRAGKALPPPLQMNCRTCSLCKFGS